MMKSRVYITIVFGVLVLGLGAAIFNYMQRPSADVAKNTGGTLVVWGEVLNENNQSMPNIVVQIGDQAYISEPQGSYYVITKKNQMAPVHFFDPVTKEQYQLYQEHKQFILIGEESHIQRDFIITKVN